MFGLFRLIFSAKYWKTLFHQETWRRSRVSLRRAHKDPRARKQLRSLLILLLAPFLFLIYIGWIVGSAAGFTGAAIAAVLIAGVSIYRNRQPIEKEGPITLSISSQPTPEAEPPAATPELRKEIANLALLHAVLADRAGSESFVQTKVLPPGVEVVTRRHHLDLLRQHGLYDRLGAQERDLLLLPDGHWQPDKIRDATMLLEALRLLRWVLRVDDFLPAVGSSMSADYRLAGSIVKQPELLFAGSKMTEMADLRIGIEAAEQYFYRCWAEGVHRGLYQLDDQDQATRLKDYAERLKNKEAEDYLLGASIVSRASDADVRLAATLGLRRAQVLRWIRQRLYGEVPANETLEAFYLH